MSAKKITLEIIAKDLLDEVLLRFRYKVGPLLTPSATEEIHSKVDIKGYLFQDWEKTIDVNTFRKFLHAPQIEDLLISYMEILLASTATKLPLECAFAKDSVIIYLINILEQHYPDLSNSQNEHSIREFFQFLFSSCEEEFDIDAYADTCKKENGTFFLPSYYEDRLKEKKYNANLISKVKYILESEYIPFNSKFDSAKKEYSKSLRQLFQTGFIYLLGEYKFNEFYVPPIVCNGVRADSFMRQIILRHKDKISIFRERWKHIFDNTDIVYIIGGAGYGKSLFLKNLVNNHSKLSISNSADYLVIYCDLKTYYTNGNNNKKTVVDFLEESMINLTGVENISKDMIQYYLKTGRCLVLLDALDEVTKDVRQELHKKVVVFFSNQNPNNKICITSRARGFIPQKDIEVTEILPLIDKDIEEYIDKMIDLKKFKKSDKDRFLQQAQILIEKDFLNNFLMLSLLVNIYKAEKALPENKIELYRKCFEYIAKKREKENAQTGYDWNLIIPLMKDSTFISLAVLAAPNNKDIPRAEIEERLIKQYKTKYTDEATTERAINEFLEFCSNRTELFVPASVDDKFKFFHRSFFEFFYSKHIYLQSEISKMYELMEAFDIDSEVFELTVALVKEDQEEKYQALIEYIFERVENEFNNSKTQYTAFAILTLAMQVVDDAYFVGKYYDLLIKYHQILITPSASRLNQKLITSAIDKAFANNEERKNVFFQKYRTHCLYFLLDKLSDIELGKRYSFFPTVDKLSGEHQEFFYLQTGNGNIPFYLCQFSSVDSLFGFMEIETVAPFGELVKGFNRKISQRQKNILSKGYKTYISMTDEDRIRALKAICIRKYEV